MRTRSAVVAWRTRVRSRLLRAALEARHVDLDANLGFKVERRASKRLEVGVVGASLEAHLALDAPRGPTLFAAVVV